MTNQSQFWGRLSRDFVLSPGKRARCFTAFMFRPFPDIFKAGRVTPWERMRRRKRYWFQRKWRGVE